MQCMHRTASVTLVAFLAAGAQFVSQLLTASPAGAEPEPCADVQVLFARGRAEDPGIGRVGTAFVDALTPDVEGRSIAVYPVDYPAAGIGDYGAGANDMSRELQEQAGLCPQSKFVVGGYSLGAAATSLVIGAGLPGFGFNQPLPPDVGDRIEAVVMFGATKLFGSVTSPVFESRTINLCNEGDPICSNGNNRPAHSVYETTALPAQAAAFAASRLS